VKITPNRLNCIIRNVVVTRNCWLKRIISEANGGIHRFYLTFFVTETLISIQHVFDIDI